MLTGIILGVCLLFVFLWVEAKVSNPAISSYLWKSGPFLVMLVAIFAFGGSFSTWFFISTQLCVNLLGYSTILTAVYFLVCLPPFHSLSQIWCSCLTHT